ncbi:uncharacterized protein GGS25DRAFT_485834 [Hypoxylon fragiforme]|uniref:uncharacterized protein n=1 Tax=Hypoxylon fragiforme TaxID=63214 RepID=UPI0020C5C72C|nr:uncharacterized protein GGS25DRAFT_485834 [Hypoxylon fragiforme]KAI2609696.1 hypothetical protein GGS25DRAFT_485834 [Hypoxylon fragiforme]
MRGLISLYMSVTSPFFLVLTYPGFLISQSGEASYLGVLVLCINNSTVLLLLLPPAVAQPSLGGFSKFLPNK